jgi:hypothetical protein
MNNRILHSTLGIYIQFTHSYRSLHILKLFVLIKSVLLFLTFYIMSKGQILSYTSKLTFT